MKKYLIILALSAVFFTGCTRTEKHIAAGVAVGAVAGHAIGGDTGAIIGAGVGAGTGAYIAKEKYDDKDYYYRHDNGRRHKKYK